MIEQIQNFKYARKYSFNLQVKASMLTFEDLIQKVNETIYLSHFYTSDHLTQIHKVLFTYHMQFFQKVLVSTMC